MPPPDGRPVTGTQPAPRGTVLAPGVRQDW